MDRSDETAPVEEAEPLLIRRSAFALAALALSTIFLITIPVAAWVYATQRPPVDFVSFWAAGRLAASGHPALAYDLELHRALERTVTTIGPGFMPFPYPPPFLLAVVPVAIRPFWLAYLLWIGVTSGLFLAATWRLLPPRFAFAHPAAIVNAIIGQNGFLTSSIFVFGISTVAAQPLLGGAILGLLVVKPQLAILIPVALLASRNWRAIAAGIASALILLALAAAVFGIDSYRAFLAALHEQAALVANYEWDWSEQVSVFAFFRWFGVDRAIALGLQGIVALGAAAITWRAWAADLEQRAAILAAATILVPPYLFTYDSLILILPLAVFLRDPARPWRPVILWVSLFLPFLGYLEIYPGPNTIPIGAILSLWWLLRDSADKKKAAAPFDAAANA